MFSALLGLGVAAAASAAGYQSMAPTGQWYGRTFAGLKRASKQIALTYDDGPNDPHTFKLLEVLARHEVHNHTLTHPLLIFESAAKTRTELVECRTALTDAVGKHSNLFRPPFGGRRPVTLRIARDLGLEMVMWNVTGYDWNAPSAAYVEKKVVGQMHGGDVILLHDGGHRAMGADRGPTVIATDNLIRRYKDQGFQFVTVTEMMEEVGRPTSAIR